MSQSTCIVKIGFLYPVKLRSANEKGNEDFNKKIKQFIASKADLLFSMEGKRKLQKGVNYGRHPNQEGNLSIIIIEDFYYATSNE